MHYLNLFYFKIYKCCRNFKILNKIFDKSFKQKTLIYMKKTFILQTMLKILNVAEKNDAAKSIAAHLSKGTSRMVNLI